MSPPPSPLLIHADWSVHPQKRWLSTAALTAHGYFIAPPQPVGPLDTFFARWRAVAPDQPILFGFDFPIGLPEAYAEKVEISSFCQALQTFSGKFYQPATTSEQISLERPFYPARPGGAHKQQLVQALNFSSASDLMRLCERPTASRRAAGELFWTLGARQVGRAAAVGWRDLLAPAVLAGQIKLWPFAGDLATLLQQPGLIAAESYPAETYCHLGLSKNFGKRKQTGRASQAPTIGKWCQANHLVLDKTLATDIQNGFGDAPNADDRFDSFIGVLGLIEVASNPAKFQAPANPVVQQIEGWILGMPAPAEP